MLHEDTVYLNLKQIQDQLSRTFESNNEIKKLKMHLDFQKVHQTSWKSTNIEHLNPLFSRIDTAFSSLEKVIEVVEDISDKYKTLNIISLVHANQEITRLIPMLLSKMIYDEQKKIVAGKDVAKTKHLIIDEAHNILNADYRNNGDDWQDYRLSVFEEIIKEGRKFGFYLTLSSQRPADISPTILSQTHNYLIHRLVNEKDLRMLESTMPTLDKSSYQKIPSLGQGEAIITGNAIQVPIFVKVDKEEKNRPRSDDINLTELWSRKHISL
jgi:DNA helicase HerA-like ATPase